MQSKLEVTFVIHFLYIYRNTNPGDWSILAGRTHKSAPEPETEQIRIASKIIPCPNPTLSFLNKDICLVKVDKEFMYNRYVRPICLPTRPVKQTDRCYVKGWGSTYGLYHLCTFLEA